MVFQRRLFLPFPIHSKGKKAPKGALQKWKKFIPVRYCAAKVKQKSRSILLPSVVIEKHHRNARIHQITYLSTYRVCLLQSPIEPNLIQCIDKNIK